MKKLLWLDDLRNPFKDEWLKYSPIEKPFDTVWVKNYKEFTEYITENGLPTAICFDHDLADTHYTPEEYWSDYHKSKEYQSKQIHKEMTGLDCAKWLVNYCMDNSLTLPKWYCQSANPVGKDNINGFLVNYLRSICYSSS